MGDDGRLYVRPEMPAAFRDLIAPLAVVLTPNQFEAEQLTGRAIASEADALAACRLLHERGPHTVVGGWVGGWATAGADPCGSGWHARCLGVLFFPLVLALSHPSARSSPARRCRAGRST
jgi:hypothetical protein